MVRQVTELEVNMNAVERMVEWETARIEAPSTVDPRPPQPPLQSTTNYTSY